MTSFVIYFVSNWNPQALFFNIITVIITISRNEFKIQFVEWPLRVEVKQF